jgi:hypothetical protein
MEVRATAIPAGLPFGRNLAALRYLSALPPGATLRLWPPVFIVDTADTLDFIEQVLE